MYNQLIYFVIALLLFAIQQPGDEPFFSPMEALFLGAGFFLLYILTCRAAMRRLKHALTADIPRSTLISRYLGTQNRLSILALVNLGIDVYLLNIKYYLQGFPLFQQSLTLPGITGLGLFLIHLAVIWLWSYPIYQRIYHSNMKPGAFLRENLAFSTAILVPWFLISIVSDVLQFLKFPVFLKTEAGQFILMAVLLIACLLFAPRLVVRLWGCQALPMNALRMELEGFAEAHHFKVGNFMTWPLFGGEMLTAGIIGILPKWRYILITRGLLGLLSVDELKAVVAHEMGHVRRYHMLFFLAFFLCYSILAYTLNDLVLLIMLRIPLVLDWLVSPTSVNTTVLSAISSVPMILLLVVYFRYVFGFFLRNSERQADLYALQVIGHPFPLASSLQRIAFHSGHSEDMPSWHHFSIRQRIDFLLKAHENPEQVRRHHRKYYTAVVLFFIIVAGLNTLSFRLESSKFVRNWRTGLQASIIERAIAHGQGNHQLYSAYGSLLLELGQFGKAEAALRKALESGPPDANTLNNLAWLYATSPPPYFNPKAALELALLAAARQPDPTILDTLAEAYYVNGQAEEALEAIRKALLKEPKNPDYFSNQKQKFEEAVKKKRERGGHGDGETGGRGDRGTEGTLRRGDEKMRNIGGESTNAMSPPLRVGTSPSPRQYRGRGVALPSVRVDP
jgi:Zn-dependent protease with chaperone function